MNIFLLVAVLVTALHAHTPTPFHWEFDLSRCDGWPFHYECFTPVDGTLIRLKDISSKRADYQMYPHVVAVIPQGFGLSNDVKQWQIIMQSRSRKQKVDLAYGMKLHKSEDSENATFVECQVSEGKIVLRHAPQLDTELIDSYFDDQHLYCDFVMRLKAGTTIWAKNSEYKRISMSASVDGAVQKYTEKPGSIPQRGGEFAKKFETSHWLHYNHNCNISQILYDPKDAPPGGKLRKWETFKSYIACPDSRYSLNFIDSKGQTHVNVQIVCNTDHSEHTNHYEIRENKIMDAKNWFVERGETIRAYCHVEDKYLCPMTIPCDKEYCPYVEFKEYGSEYQIKCDNFFDIRVYGERESPFSWLGHSVYCNEQHNFVAEPAKVFPDKWKSPTTIVTEAYCVRKEDFVHPNCTRRNPLCNGKSCSIVKSDKPHKFSVTCTDPNNVFQEFSTDTKKWSDREKELHCNSNGDWDKTGQKFVRCKDPKDTSPPVEWEAPKTGSKADSKASPSEESGPENGQMMIGHSIALLIATVILAGI